jgi:hypothetical protein
MAALGVGLVWLFGARAQVHQIAGTNALAAILVIGALVIVVLAVRAGA